MDRLTTPNPPLWVSPWFIVSAAMALRLTWALLVPVDPVSDSVLYDAFAKSIASGKGYAFPDGNLTVYWPVGASAVYGLLYAVFGTGYWTIATFQVLLGGLIVWLTWRLATQYGDAVTAALAAWFTALWPLLIEFTTVLASELLFIALLLAALNAWAARSLAPLVRAVLWGICIAGATYVRPTAWPLLLIFPCLEWLVDRRWRASLVTVLASTLTAAVLFAPWVYRNYQLFDRFVLIAANGGPNLWMGNNPASTGGYMSLPDRLFANEVERDRFFGREAVDFIKSNPLAYLRLSLRRAAMSYDRETIGIVWNEASLKRHFGTPTVTSLKLLSTAFWWVMLLLGLLGALLTWRQRQVVRLWPLLAALFFFAIVPILTVGQDRYHVPINPLLAIFASWGTLTLLRRSKTVPVAHTQA